MPDSLSINPAIVKYHMMPPKFKRHLRYSDVKSSNEIERENLLGDYHDDEDEEDDFFMSKSPVAGRSKGAGKPTDPKIQRVQGQVDEVIDIMQDNIGKVLDRGERLEDLQDKSETLAYNATMFRVSAKGLRSHFWWQEFKMRLILLTVLIVLLLVIFIPVILKNMNR